MRRIIGFAFALVTGGMIATTSHAVVMFGSHGEGNGIIVNIPQNPPIVDCVPPGNARVYAPHATVAGKATLPSFIELRPNVAHPTVNNDARCGARNSEFNFSGRKAPSVFNRPQRGLQVRQAGGKQWLDGVSAGLNVGDPFTVPPFAFNQQLGRQIGVVLNSATRQLDTTFNVAMPPTNRNSGMQPAPLPNGPYTAFRTPAAMQPVPALTRMFSQMNWANPGNGQNNNANPNTAFPTLFEQRTAANPVPHVNVVNANEKIRVNYFAGPREFGGTMALLLDGTGVLWLGGPLLNGAFPAAMQQVAGKQPVGDAILGFRARNADGWNNVHKGKQDKGTIKAFFSGFNPANKLTPMGAQRFAPNCVVANPPSPVGCNEINGFTTFMVGTPTSMIFSAALKTSMGKIRTGGTVRTLFTASSDKHVFPLTTGTVSIVRVANRAPVGAQTLTITGMGYDTVGVTPMGAPQRNVGLVAGSYSVRTDFPPTGPNTNVNPQMMGVDIKFAPEPASSAALASAFGLIGFLAYRRRSA